MFRKTTRKQDIMTDQTVIVGIVFGTRGEEDTDYIGVVDTMDTPRAMDTVELTLTPQEKSRALDGLLLYRQAMEEDFDALEKLTRRIRQRVADHRHSMYWLTDMHKAAAKQRDDDEQAIWQAQADADRLARQEEQAREDAELGPRNFVRMDRKDLTGQEKHRRWAEGADLFKLHKVGCRLLPDLTRVGERSILRIGEAIDLYVHGAEVCGVCHPDDALITDEAQGQKARDARSIREAVVIPMTTPLLMQAASTGTVPWALRGKAGAIVVKPGTETVLAPGELMVGWVENGDYRVGLPIPAEHRGALYGAMAGNKWWTVRWTRDDGAGYLVVGQMTKAQRRAARELADGPAKR